MINCRIRSRMARDIGAIRISKSRKSVVAAVRTAREALQAGDLVCIFPEGKLTRTGQMHEFHPGFLSMLKGNDAPVIPVCLHGLWGSIFSFERGKFFWKWPRRWRYPITILFGKPIQKPESIQQVRRAVEELDVKAAKMENDSKLIPAR